MPAAHVYILGEAMLELSGTGDAVRLGDTVTLAQGGDTLNTAVHMARAGITVDYVTALGLDPYSRAMVAAWQGEGIGIRHVLRHPERLPGLYAIRTDAEGERSFHYWRDNSAARALFDLPEAEAAIAAAECADWLYFSGISLSILPHAGRERLLDLAAAVRKRGGRVAFDPNFRPRGWPDPSIARSLFARLAPDLDLVLPSLDDEDVLYGRAEPGVHMARWREAGAGMVVAKQGAQGCWVLADTMSEPKHHPTRPAERVVDTTGAGDGFNAGFLAAIINGATPGEAALAANALAREVVGHPGAIAPSRHR